MTGITENLKDLKTCLFETSHPLFLPFIILSYQLSPSAELKQRGVRSWLRTIEHAVMVYAESLEDTVEKAWKLDEISLSIEECYAHTLWKSPVEWIPVIQSFRDTMEVFLGQLPESEAAKKSKLEKIHSRFVSGLEFYKCKQHGMQVYIDTTQQRLHNQQGLVSFPPRKLFPTLIS
jgi:hypothetical protein